MGGEKVGQGRGNVQGAEGHRGTNPQHAARLGAETANDLLHLFRLFQHARAVRRHGGADFRQAQVSRGALKQAGAEGFLEPGDGLAHDRPGGADAPRGFGKTPGFDHARIDGQQIQVCLRHGSCLPVIF
jgi:hypothetical protein